MLDKPSVFASGGFCDAWDVPAAPAADRRPVEADSPVLLVAGSGDPISPPRALRGQRPKAHARQGRRAAWRGPRSDAWAALPGESTGTLAGPPPRFDPAPVVPEIYPSPFRATTSRYSYGYSAGPPRAPRLERVAKSRRSRSSAAARSGSSARLAYVATNRPERLLEELTVIARALRPLDILAAGHLQRAEPVAEQLSHVFLAAPQRWRQRSRRGWRHVGRERAEEVGDQALGGEVEHPDRAPGAAHAHHLVGYRLMVGSEDRAERRGDNVEFAVAEGESLGVGLDPFQLDPLRLRLAAARPRSSRA